MKKKYQSGKLKDLAKMRMIFFGLTEKFTDWKTSFTSRRSKLTLAKAILLLFKF
jgi:hypothetical protein